MNRQIIETFSSKRSRFTMMCQQFSNFYSFFIFALFSKCKFLKELTFLDHFQMTFWKSHLPTKFYKLEFKQLPGSLKPPYHHIRFEPSATVEIPFDYLQC